ncbi:MAG: glycosyltransferase [Gammaproteobacteria bacterium]|nr:glycosyltransferase [Gammaproteobacteria bacterium]
MARTLIFTPEGEVLTDIQLMTLLGGEYNKLHTQGLNVRERVSELTKQINWYAFYSVYRASVINESYFEICFGSDVIYLLHILLQGEIITLDRKLFNYTVINKTAEQQMSGIGSTVQNGAVSKPYTSLLKRLIEIIYESHYSDTLKEQMKMDLLNNISSEGSAWKQLLLEEDIGLEQEANIASKAGAGQGVNIIGYVSGNLGLGAAARSIVKSLLERSVDVCIVDLDPGLNRFKKNLTYKDYFVQSTAQLHDINIFVLPPPSLTNWVVSQVSEHKINIAFPMWELPHLNAEYLDNLNSFDAIIAGTRFLFEVFSRELSGPHVIYSPHPHYMNTVTQQIKKSYSVIRFMTSFEPVSDVVRKNPLGAINAFKQAFPAEQDVELVIKVNNAYYEDQLYPEVSSLISLCEGDDRIVFILERLDEQALVELYASVSVFISLHRSEGLGLVPLEMMAQGVPVIATHWSGVMDFMNADNSYPVRHSMEPANGLNDIYQSYRYINGNYWAEPNLNDAIKWMRFCHQNPDDVKQRGERARLFALDYLEEANKAGFYDQITSLLLTVDSEKYNVDPTNSHYYFRNFDQAFHTVKGEYLDFIELACGKHGSINEATKQEVILLAVDHINSYLQRHKENKKYVLSTPYGGLHQLLSSLRRLAGKVKNDYISSVATFCSELILNIHYQVWIKNHALLEVDAEVIAERMMLEWQNKPVFHCFLFVLPGEEFLLADTIDSLAGQFYPQWQLTVIAGTEAPDPIFDEAPNLHWCMVDDGKSPYDALNEQISAHASDWVSFIEPGVQFEAITLATLSDYINLYSDWSFIYTDDDLINADGERSSPRFKPDFNLDLLRSSHYIGNGWMQAQSLIDAGGVQKLAGAENFDLALRWRDLYGEKSIGHIADVLIHKSEQVDRPFDSEAGRIALSQHLERNTLDATIFDGYVDNSYRVEYLFQQQPKVSIIIPTKDKLEFLQPCIDSLLDKTVYPNYEVIIVDNQSSDPDTLAYYDVLTGQYPDKVKVFYYDKPFNFSAMNNWASEQANGEYLLLLNNDTEIIQGEWLTRMMSYGQRKDVGIVGARLIYPGTGAVQHVGVILGLKGIAEHPYNNELGLNDSSYMDRAQLDQNFSAVTAAVMLVRKDIYKQLEGMDAENFAVLYNDVDLCLRVVEAGYKIVWTPYAIVAHHGNVSVGQTEVFSLYNDVEYEANKQSRSQKERRIMLQKWLSILAGDPAYNKNLSLSKLNYDIELNAQQNWDVNFHSRPRCLGKHVTGGSGDYRIRQPFEALSSSGLAHCEVVLHHVSATEIERLKPDTYVLQNPIEDTSLDLLKMHSEFNPKVFRVFSLDDLLHDLPEKNVLHRSLKQNFRDMKSRIRKALSYCDRLVVSTQPLADLCVDMIDDIRVIPNRLMRDKWCNVTSLRNQSNKPRVGWVGAKQHDGDLEIIFDVIKQTSAEIDWVFMGMCPDEIIPYIKEYHEFVPMEEYPQTMASLNLDLAVAPLEINAYNEAKSNLRLLEYGVLGWPVICTDIYPYQTNNAPVTRVNNETEAWLTAIRTALANPDELKRKGDELKAWVLKGYILEDHLDDWADALNIKKR